MHNKIYYLPNEIIINILHKLETFNDIRNVYQIFKKHKNIIDIEIRNYLNIRYKHKHWLYRIIQNDNFIDKYIKEDYIDELKDNKDYKLEIIKEMYNEDYISKKVIKYYLEYYKCEYFLGKGNIRHFQYCWNCKNTFCNNCYYINCFGSIFKGIKNFHYYTCLDCSLKNEENMLQN